MILWLTGILNSIIDLEVVPDVLKCGITVPVYKGSRKDPLKAGSYRGVTLSSVIAKVLEILVLDRLQILFLEAAQSVGIPEESLMCRCNICYAGSDCKISKRWE